MMGATFFIGLAVSGLILLISNVLYYVEHGALTNELTARRRCWHILHIRRAKLAQQLSVGHAENELIRFYYGNDGNEYYYRYEYGNY
jgi:hypothetical protein